MTDLRFFTSVEGDSLPVHHSGWMGERMPALLDRSHGKRIQDRNI
jgi:hypothetical protein